MVVLGVLLAFMAVSMLALATGTVVWVVSALRERRIWRDGGEPYIPSRVYIDERYGGADADPTRQTGFLGLSGIAAYNAALGHAMGQGSSEFGHQDPRSR
jgi:hypothetical protein